MLVQHLSSRHLAIQARGRTGERLASLLETSYFHFKKQNIVSSLLPKAQQWTPNQEIYSPLTNLWQPSRGLECDSSAWHLIVECLHWLIFMRLTSPKQCSHEPNKPNIFQHLTFEYRANMSHNRFLQPQAKPVTQHASLTTDETCDATAFFSPRFCGWKP